MLDESVVRSLVGRADARAAVRRALVALAEDRAVLPGEIAMVLDAGELHVKGGYLRGSGYVSAKVAGGFPGNAAAGRPVNDGFSIVLDAATGALVAVLLDHGWLTELRTGAAGALAADLLARPDATAVGLVGAGAQARFQIEALLDVRPVRTVRIWNRTGRRAQDLAGRLAGEFDLDATAVGTVEEAVCEADIVVTTTASREPLVFARWLRPGTHVTAVGSDFPDKQELSVDVLARADVVAADRVASCARVGELHHALEAGVLAVDAVVELAELAAGTARGRTGEDQITVADQCGLGVYDAAMAELVLTRHLAVRP
ncbi:MAG TPA: hypothetical protein VD813_12395 [Pseudonocardia sp.]|nr:hypothetical protein [Pseudonocardia sp.]